MTKIHITIPLDLKNLFKAKCSEMGLSMDFKTRELIKVFLGINKED